MPPVLGFLIAAILVGFCPAVAFAQGAVRQNGPVTPGHLPMWIGNSLVIDAGGSPGAGLSPVNKSNAGSLPTGMGIVNSGLGYCQFSAFASAAYKSLCFGFDGAGGGLIDLEAVGGGTSTLTVRIGGTNYPFPGSGLGNVIAPTSPAPTTGHVALFNGTTTVKGGGPLSRVSVMDPLYGAICDGTTDDTAAIAAALATGFKLTGNNKVCAVSGNVLLPNNTDLADIEIKQLSAGATTRTLKHTTGDGAGTSIQLTNVKVNMNAANTVGTIADAAGIWISDIASVRLDNVEVYGGGKGIGINIVNFTSAVIQDPYVHDFQWSNPVDPTTEQIVGIWFQAGSNVILTNPRVKNLTGIIGANPAAPYQSDGIDFSGIQHVSMFGGAIDNVGEGTDTFSSIINNDIWVYGTQYNNVGSFGLKMGSITDSGSVGVRCKDPGLACIVVGANSTTPPGMFPNHIRHYDMMAINTGSSGVWSGASAFLLNYDGTAGVAPVDIQCVNCTAIGDGANMAYGFRADDGSTLLLVNPSASGYATAYFHDNGLDRDLSAGIAPPIQALVPVSGGTVTFTDPMITPSETMLIDPAGALATLTITLPHCSTTQFGIEVSFVSTQNVTTLNFSTPGGEGLTGNIASLTANEGHKFKCYSHHWYRFQ